MNTTQVVNFSLIRGQSKEITPEAFLQDETTEVSLDGYTKILTISEDEYGQKIAATFTTTSDFNLSEADTGSLSNSSYYYDISVSDGTITWVIVQGILTVLDDYADFLKKLFPDSHPVTEEIYGTVLDAFGYVLDLLNPYQIGLNLEFSVTTATGTALDSQGADWGVYRRSGETDNAYRARILGILPIYANGASISGMKASIDNFIGAEPTIYDLCTDGYSPGDSAPADNALSDMDGLFTVLIYINNPYGTSYSHYDLEYLLKQSKPARSKIILHHNGTDTSPLDESSDAVLTLV
jgi:hypothetical protein